MTEKIKPMFPNAVTMLALACGVSSMNMALWGNWQMAVVFIMLSALFDFMDGKVARMLGVSSRFGAELDSLSDFVSFGVAPGFLMYNWTMNEQMRVEAIKDIAFRADAGGLYWGVALFLAVCCASRLARFNTMIDEEQPSYWTHFFMGVPAPAGGALALLPLVLWLACKSAFDVEVDFFRNAGVVSFLMIFSGVMMASRIPTLCLKHLHFSKNASSVLGFCLMGMICGLVAFPWLTMGLLGVAYLISIPVSVYFFLKFKKAAV